MWYAIRLAANALRQRTLEVNASCRATADKCPPIDHPSGERLKTTPSYIPEAASDRTSHKLDDGAYKPACQWISVAHSDPSARAPRERWLCA